jgi:hypothetical protein
MILILFVGLMYRVCALIEYRRPVSPKAIGRSRQISRLKLFHPPETADEVRDKVRDFLAAGTPLVWTLYSRAREVVVHTLDGLARTYSGKAMLEFPDVLPGFSCIVAKLFA